jgi:predicted TIM-barrel fold metal-dependent hydrolase
MLQCAITELGVERILFAVDWPFNSNVEGVEFVRTASIEPQQKAQIFAGNASALLRV